MRRLFPFYFALFATIGLHCQLSAQAVTDPSDPDPRKMTGERFGPGADSAFIAENGMVSSASTAATIAGVETLQRGGNAFDAAAVVQFVLNATEPYGSGIGGGAFLIFYDAKSEEVFHLDGREETPRAFSPERFRDSEGKVIPFPQRIRGGNPVGVPGTLASMDYLLKKHGTLTLAEALQPAIHIARRGIPINKTFAGNLKNHENRLHLDADAKKLFYRDDGTLMQEGDLFRNPDLAQTFENIAKNGIAWFYNGELANEIVNTVRNNNQSKGVLSKEDLTNYRPVLREPIHTQYRGHEIYGINLPSSGGITVAQTLKLLEFFPKFKTQQISAAEAQRFGEAQNLAFADRNHYLADADFVDVPIRELLAPDYVKQRASLIGKEKTFSTPVAYGVPSAVKTPPPTGNLKKEGTSTTHFSICDSSRNIIAVTTTIQQHFGSGVVVPNRGFLLNNILTDFNATVAGESSANEPGNKWKKRRTALGEAAETEGGKRPRSSMSPTIIMKDGKPRFVLGSPGGTQIIGVVLNVITNLIDREMDVQQAVNAPRLITRNGVLELENPFFKHNKFVDELKARGFEVNNTHVAGSVQAIKIEDDGRLYGAVDPRRIGLVYGY